jgi:hypothetical protein
MEGFMNLVSGVVEFGGYLPLIGSCIGVGRMAIGGTAAIISGLAAVTFSSQHSQVGAQKSFDGVAFGIEQFLKGIIELIPCVKIIVKAQQIWNSSPNRWSLSVL